MYNLAWLYVDTIIMKEDIYIYYLSIICIYISLQEYD